MHNTLTRYIAALEGISTAKTPKGVLAAVKKYGVKSSGPDTLRPKFLSRTIDDPELAEAAFAEVKKENPRKKNIYFGNPVKKAPKPGKFAIPRWETIHYRGKFKGWKGSKIYADYSSRVRYTSDGRTARLIQSGEMGPVIPAPAGMRWGSDSNGVKLVRISDGMDYHPTLEDYRAKDFASRVRKAMARNYLARHATAKSVKEAARFEKIFGRESGSCIVTLEDSRRAGNCVEGTLRFAERKLKCDRSAILAAKHLFGVRASQLRAHANGDAQRAEAAIRQAWMRETTVCI